MKNDDHGPIKMAVFLMGLVVIGIAVFILVTKTYEQSPS